MIKISIEAASEDLRILLKRVASGEEVVFVDRDVIVARLLPPVDRNQWLNRRRDFREGIQTQGASLQETIIQARGEERY